MATINADLLRSKFGFNNDAVIQGILSDPSQVERYNRELGGGTSGTSGGGDASALYDRQKADLATREAANLKTETDFGEKFRLAVEGLEPLEEIRKRTVSEFGGPDYETTKEGLYQAGREFEAIPENVRVRGKQAGMSINRINARIAAKLGDKLPELEKVSADFAHVEDLINQAFQLRVGDRENALLPLQQEAAALSDRMNRMASGYTALVQSQTTAFISELEAKGRLDVQKMTDLAANARAENQYFDSEITTKDGRKVIMNMKTGEIIMDLGADTTGGGGGNALADIQNWATTGTTSTGNVPGTNLPYQQGQSVRILPN